MIGFCLEINCPVSTNLNRNHGHYCSIICPIINIYLFFKSFINCWSNIFANCCLFLSLKALGPLVSIPVPLNSCIKFLIDSLSRILDGVKRSPWKLITTIPFGTRIAANGISCVITRSLSSDRSAINVSATSGPWSTLTKDR